MRDFEVNALIDHELQLLGAERGHLYRPFRPARPALDVRLSPFPRPHHPGGRPHDPAARKATDSADTGPSWRAPYASAVPTRSCWTGFALCVEAQAETARRCVPGALAADIGRAHDDFMLAHGGVRELRLYAHGMGYDMVERPLIREDETMTLQPGCSLAIHPTLPTATMLAHVCDNYLVDLDGTGGFHPCHAKTSLRTLKCAADRNHALDVRYTLRAFTRALAVVAGPSNLTTAEFRLLRTLGEGGGATQAELAAAAAMGPPLRLHPGAPHDRAPPDPAAAQRHRPTPHRYCVDAGWSDAFGPPVPAASRGEPRKPLPASTRRNSACSRP